jgi:ribosomal protein S18 acetylase RimI-like enzyme
VVEVIRPIEIDRDEARLSAFLDAELGSRMQARLGELVDVLALPGFVACEGDDVHGVITYAAGGARAELAALAVARPHRNQGIGGQLVEAVTAATGAEGASTLWLLTTNDNLDALRLYQRHGFRIVEVHVGGVDNARTLKPTIPEIGDFGIPLHDELVLERQLL